MCQRLQTETMEGMLMTDPVPTLDQVLALAQRLPRLARAQLIARLALTLIDVSPLPNTLLLPIIASGTWSDDIPLRRDEIYDDNGRA